MLTPAFNHLLCFNFVCCAKKVSKLINHPVVNLLGTQMGGTITEVIAKVTQKILVTLNCEGMTTTAGVETEISSHAKEVSKRRLSRLRKGQRNILLILKDTILGGQSNTSSCVDL